MSIWIRIAPLAGLLALAVPVAAQDLSAGAQDFTFRRVKPPQAGSGRFITVQIDPVEQAARLAVPKREEKPQNDAAQTALAEALPQPAGPLDWYWKEVSPALGDGAGRFTKALTALTKAPGGGSVPAPRLQAMQEIANTHGTEILKATIGTRVSPALVLAVIGIESSGRVDVVSSAGAEGLMQLMPATAERFGVDDSKDASQNIKGGVAYLDWLIGEFDGDPLMVLAAYNAGEGAVRGAGGVPAYAETRAYVPKVLAAWVVAQGLCQTPPELISDGCVFKVIASG